MRDEGRRGRRAVIAALVAISVLLMGAGGGCERETGTSPRPREDPGALDNAGRDEKSALVSIDWTGGGTVSVTYSGPDGTKTVTQRAQKDTSGFFRQALVIPKGKPFTVSVGGTRTAGVVSRMKCSVKWINHVFSPKSGDDSVGPCRLNLLNDEPDIDDRPTSVRTLGTLTYEGMIIQFPDKVPSAQAFRQAQNRPDQMLLIVQWSGNRRMAVYWSRTGPTLPVLYKNEYVSPHPAENGLSTWAYVMTVEPDSYVELASTPDDQSKGTNRCVMYFKGERIQDHTVQRGRVMCDYLLPI